MDKFQFDNVSDFDLIELIHLVNKSESTDPSDLEFKHAAQMELKRRERLNKEQL